MGGSGGISRAEGLGQGPCCFRGGSGGRQEQSQELPLLVLTFSDAGRGARDPCRQSLPPRPLPERTAFPGVPA